jgi:hypothetical protein
MLAVRGLGTQAIGGLLGHDGVFRAHRQATRRRTPRPLDYAAAAATFKQAEDRATVVPGLGDSINRFLAHRVLAHYPLTAVVAVSEEEVLADYQRQREEYFLYA